MGESFLEKMTDYITSITFDDLSPELCKVSKFAIIDTMAVALGGWKEPSIEILKKVYQKRPSNNVMASLWGDSEQIPLEYAALINGTATHALDFDDVTPTVLAHPSAPITASILTLGEYLGKSAKEILVAYVIGTEIMISIGKVMGFQHYNLGWHSTSTLGTIGATAACSYLMGFDKEKVSNAIAISASMSGGLQKNFGTMTKPLHVGLSAQHAIQTVLLANEGFTGNKEIFGERGFFHAYSGSVSFEQIAINIKEINFGREHDYMVNGLSVKKFPCCYLTHRFIDGLLKISTENNLSLNDVKSIKVSVPPNGLTALIYQKPTTGLQGKFSAEYTCLAAVEDGTIQLNSFTDQMVQRVKIQNMFDIVLVKEYEGSITNSTEIEDLPVFVSVETNGGQLIEKKVLHAPGSKNRPLSLEEYRAKWSDCLRYVTGNSEVEQKRIDTLFEQGVKMENLEYVSEWIENIKEFMADGKKASIIN
ncbi:MmgE/PrpD family protein [Psychrobacillus sp. BL-248-WT-3]|uniref:MmgE/PrpD family protein n=1 Tax=Psychrobacillus sp. BL-248-WT-3 TaxID=2725306 RepID=UPI00146BC4FF|nr:MmgE/PrpD family protein [Psychrobacillus sp. BL-248-WT-3]NME07552.1 MmgE/PrpD family protein [Psychrobacillus sp. BL-248-WT-3]